MNAIDQLLQRAERYLKSADLLLRDGDHESSISRSYYAMFFAAQAVLLTRELSFSSHKGVLSAFGKHFIKTGLLARDLGRELNRAFEKRQLGDYGYTFVISREEAEETRDQGTQFVAAIRQFIADAA